MGRLVAVALIAATGCGSPDAARRAPAETVQVLEIAPERVGTNLPPWAACWFPHRANPAAVARAQPCPPESRATRAYTARELAGCWRITREDHRTPVDTPFFAGPVRLLTRVSDDQRKLGFDDPGSYGVVPLSPIPSDTLPWPLSAVMWSFSPPDSLSIKRASRYAGSVYTFRVRGDSMVGIAQHWTDVVQRTFDTIPDPVERLHGRRVPCRRDPG